MKLASFLAQLTSLGEPFIIRFYLCTCYMGRQSHLSEQAWSRRKRPGNRYAARWARRVEKGALLPGERKNWDRPMRLSST